MRLSLPCLLTTSLVFAANPAQARTQVLKTQAGSVVHWTRAELTIGIDSSAASQRLDRLDVVLAVQRAARAWNRIPAEQPQLRFTSATARDVTIRFCRGTWQGDTIDLGRTQFGASPVDGSVSTAVVELNECEHQFAPPGEAANSPFDLQSVMTHELGHVLGLGHGDERTSIMFPSGNGVLARGPSADDITALAVIYVGREPLVGKAGVARATPPAPAAGSAQASHAGRIARSGAVPPGAPADSVPVLNLKSDHGRDVTIYTAEPTLLPALAQSRPGKEGKRAPSAPAKAR